MRKEELKGLIENRTFVMVQQSLIPQVIRLFGSHFIDELKKSDHTTRTKRLLVDKNYDDDEARYIDTKAPTTQRFSQRLAIYFAASAELMELFKRDFMQVYIQHRMDMERDVYMNVPKELELLTDFVLRVVEYP